MAAQVTVQRGRLLVGQSLKRVEDLKFVTGSGAYLDDLKFPNVLYAAFVRSPHAHAKILSMNAEPALASPGVVGVLTGKDLEGKVEPLPTVDVGSSETGTVSAGGKRATVRRVLAVGEVKFAGEAVAAVFAESYYQAEDAAELVEVEYETLGVVVDAGAAMEPSSPRVHMEFPDNIAYHYVHKFGDVGAAFRSADKVIRVKLLNQRVHPVSMEPRGIAASYDVGNDALTVWLSTQDPHNMRNELAKLLRMEPTSVRLIAPDVGGGFGGKAAAYPEDVVVCFAAAHFRRPIKWEESRREHMLTMTHGRGQNQWAEIAVRNDGKILGYKIKIVSDGGAYSDGSTTGLPELTAKMGTGVYDIPTYEADVYSVFTNKVPHGAYRGAGRPEAAFLIERTMNILAAKLKLDPVKIRTLNYIKKEKFPFKTPGGFTYDTGDYEANMAKALEVARYPLLLAQQREAREAGRLFGIGIVTWTEICGFGPGSPQTAAVTVNERGRIIITIGGQPHGQGHAIAMSQVAADELGVGVDRITVQHGDTNMLPWSSITAGSRSGALLGSAVLLSARKIKEKMSILAKHMLQTGDATEVVFHAGMIFMENNPGKSMRFDEVASAAFRPKSLPQGMEPTLFAYTAFVPPNQTFPFGTHITAVEIDRETGVVKLQKYFGIDDCGKLINPMLVEGQFQGGVVQGAGQALLEEIVYDENGQLLTSTLADYVIPSADTMSEMVWGRTETPTWANPLGVKGIGEAGSIAATPVILNAVEDALSEFGVVVERMPVRPDYILSLIKGEKKR
ncbi:MAG: xanthine dehydrogenase family protein molybdopterin-binding subunit [Thaumarchaeota archaeon]|nr:xanthine dehydrogenase family protein molybdopterin-binding subunit [Nitrososphaerota archaeon]